MLDFFLYCRFWNSFCRFWNSHDETLGLADKFSRISFGVFQIKCKFADVKYYNDEKTYSFLFAAILYCGVGLLTSCTAYEDNPTSTQDLFEQEMTAALVVRLGLMALRARPEGFTGSACGACMLGPQMLRARLQKIAPNFFKLDSGDATTSSRASLDVVRRIGHN